MFTQSVIQTDSECLQTERSVSHCVQKFIYKLVTANLFVNYVVGICSLLHWV
jgi:hypothetical protein